MNPIDSAFYYVGKTHATKSCVEYHAPPSLPPCVDYHAPPPPPQHCLEYHRPPPPPLHHHLSPRPPPHHVAAPPYWAEMEAAVIAVERILGYGFKNKRLLEEALTHSSVSDSVSYQRLEFLGDATLGLAISNHVFLAYPQIDPGHLSLLRSANISTEKLARVAVRHGLYGFVRRNAPALDEKVFVILIYLFLIFNFFFLGFGYKVI